jgi:CHAT domain-containing protein
LIDHATTLVAFTDRANLAAAGDALEEARQRIGTATPHRLHARWHVAAASAAWARGDAPETAALAAQGLALSAAEDGDNAWDRSQLDWLTSIARGDAAGAAKTMALPERGGSTYERLYRAFRLRNAAAGLAIAGDWTRAFEFLRESLTDAFTVSSSNYYVADALHLAASCFRRGPGGTIQRMAWFVSLKAAAAVLDVRRAATAAEALGVALAETALAQRIALDLLEGLLDPGDEEFAIEAAEMLRGRVLSEEISRRSRATTLPARFEPEPPPALSQPDASHAVFEAASYVLLEATKTLKAWNVPLPLTSDQICQLQIEVAAPLVIFQPIGERLALMVVSSGTPHRRWSPMPAAEAARAAAALLLRCSRTRAAESFAPSPEDVPREQRTLFDALFGPVLDLLPDQGTIVLVPSRELATVPFNVLEDAQGRMVIDRFAVCLVPSLGVLAHLRERKSPARQAPGHAYLCGAPTLRGLDAKRFRALTCAEAEVDKVSAMVHSAGTLASNVLVRTAAAATELSYRTEAAGADLVHLACHGAARDPATSSYLVLGPSPPHDGYLRASEIPDIPLDDALVFLSACETALGETTSEGVIGLARSFLKTGARAVIASQWKVHDRVALRTVEHFYRFLLAADASVTAAVALRDALRAIRDELAAGTLLDAEGRRLPLEAAYWSPFVIIGDGMGVRFQRLPQKTNESEKA